MACNPRLRVAQPYGMHYANEVKEVAALAGIEQTNWQVDLIKDWSAHTPDGQWIHRRCGGSIPRQAGKSVDGIVWCVFLLAILGYGILWTDHNYSTTCEMLRRFQEIFGKKPNDKDAKFKFFNDLVERVSNRTAQEAIFLKNGGFICFSTRTKSAALGFSFDIVVYDEAQELKTEHMQAIQPTTTSGAHHNTQAIFLGTPTRAGSNAEVFSDMHIEAWENPLDDMCWIEYGVDEVGDVLDETRWPEANPSIDEGVADMNAIRTGIRAFKSDVLAAAQEYLGYWLPKVANALISKKEWLACQIEPEESPKEGRIAYGVKFAPDGSEVALAAAIKPKSGISHVELVCIESMAKGTTWLADWLAERPCRASCVAVDGKAGTGMLSEKLIDRVPSKYYRVMKTQDAITASSMMLEAIQNNEITHIESPALDESVLGATKRKIGDSGGWGFGGDTSCAIEAAANALWAVTTTKRDPNRKQEASF